MSNVANYGTVIDYQDGRLICEDVGEDLYFCTAAEQYLEPGEVMDIDDLYPIKILSESEQKAIRASVAELPEDYLDFLREAVM